MPYPIARLLAAALVAAAALLAAGPSGAEEDAAPAAERTRTVEDMLGRSVEVPREIERIATVNVDAFRMLLHLGVGDRLVGIPSNMFGSRFAREKPVEARAFDGLAQTPRVGGGQPGAEIDLERVLATEPDVFLYWAFTRRDEPGALAERAERLERQLGVPVVAVSTIGSDWGSAEGALEEIETAYRLMGELTGRQERAAALLDYYREGVAQVQSRIPEAASAPRIYLAHRRNLYNHVAFYLPVEQLGAELVTAGRPGSDGEVSAEQLIKWDPAHIFLHTPSKASRVSREAVLGDARLAGVEAVEQGRVHRFKGTYMGWDLATGLIDLVHMAKILYPEAMAGVDRAERGEAILRFFYGEPGLYAHLAEQSGLEGRE
ncbi:MAG: ABC transporter substrate-binding protein [Halorhodospira sp.]